jgi:dTDP-4-dehydrorhamnose 3,5-epimerase
MHSGAAARRRVPESGRIADVVVRRLAPIPDVRGTLCEIHRDAWDVAPRPVQWDFVTTQPRVLRGVHVHQRRFDYMIVLSGRATLGLTDLRRRGPSFRSSMAIEAMGEAPCMVVIPPGVAHGIYAHGALSYLYGLTAAWDGSDEDLGCRYDDPAMGIAWPDMAATLLERDAALPDFAALVREFEAAGGVRTDRSGARPCPPRRY